MCLVVVASRVHPDFPLIVAGNRDEFHKRSSEAARWWDFPEGVLAGRDLEGGGTWLGIHRNGRFAVVTNFREPVSDTAGRRSRGELVLEALSADGSIADLIESMADRREAYGGFNLVVGDDEGLHCLSNRGEDLIDLQPGIYGLSNHRLDTPWPKVVAAREGMRDLAARGRLEPDELFSLLADRTPAPADELPKTGVSLEWERALSAAFIAGGDYGTRASTVVIVGNDGAGVFIERRFGPNGEPAGESRFEIELAGATL